MFTPDDPSLPTLTLGDGRLIPAVGFGTWTIRDGEEGYKVVLDALACGYRHIDTASIYGSEYSVGQAVRLSGIPRQHLFITTKVSSRDLGAQKAAASLMRSLDQLQMDYVDLLLIHWPNAVAENWQATLAQTWEAFCGLRERGLVGSIGVSNFLPHHFPALASDILPACNQIEYHVGWTQEEAVAYCQERGILVSAWSPLGRRRVFEHPVVQEVAARCGISVAAVCMAFVVQHGILPLPKSSTTARMRENLASLEVRLGAADLQRLERIGSVGWSELHPDHFAS